MPDEPLRAGGERRARLGWRRAGSSLWWLCAWLGVACAPRPAELVRPPPPEAPVRSPREAELTELVKQDCGSCHGLSLRGGLGRPLLRERLQGFLPQALARVILDGVPGTAMPPWRPLLSEEEVAWIVQGLQSGVFE